MYDIIIKNGNIIDGSGEAPFRADVGIKDDKIAKIGELHDEKAEIEIDASGKIVCPGFIDVNNHSDTFWRIFSNPDLESLAYQGITTIVGGNCGSSLAPLVDAKNIESIQKWIDLKNINVNWLSLEEFFQSLGEKRLSVNFATLVGHATLRRGVLRDEVRSLNPKELKFIGQKLEEAMKEGALGVSTGLVYTHARLATIEELVSLAKIAEKFDGVYATHIRSESDDLIESLEEAFEIGKKSGAKLHISHLKAVGRNNWHKLEDALALINRAAEIGINISFDIYPYTNTGSVLYTLLPDWAAEGGRKMMLSRLKDPVIRAKVISEMRNSRFEYEKVEIADSPLNVSLNQRKITEIARSQDKSVEDAIIDVLIASEGRVITSMEVLSENNIRKSIIHPFSMIATNGSGYNIEHSKTGEIVHPRSFGTFIKVLAKYIFEEEILSLEEAVKKMTSFPAEKFGVRKRGQIKENYFADILILDRRKIASTSSKENPYQYCQGIEYSVVNGKMVIEKEKYNGIKNGKIIKR